MKTQPFQIETFENVTLRNVYEVEVEAETPEQALRFLKDGMEPYRPLQQTVYSTMGEGGHRVIANF